MKTRILVLCLFLITVFLAGCAAQSKPVTDIAIPLKGPHYSILPLQEDGWTYAEGGSSEYHQVSFRKKTESKTHTFASMAGENHIYIVFSHPEDFLSYIQSSHRATNDPFKYKVIEENHSLDDRFGTNSVRAYGKFEDYTATNKGKSDFLILKLLQYVFIHPKYKNSLVYVLFSERGKPEEMLPEQDFITKALSFIDGLRLEISTFSRHELFLSLKKGESTRYIALSFGQPDKIEKKSSMGKPHYIYHYKDLGTIYFTTRMYLLTPMREKEKEKIVSKVVPRVDIKDIKLVKIQLNSKGYMLTTVTQEYYKQDQVPVAVLDLMAEKISTEQEIKDRYTVDALSWLCRIIAKSQNPRYRALLEEVSKNAASPKLQEHAKKSLKALPMDEVEQFFISGN